MPQVIHSFRGDNRAPRLKVAKCERAILENAQGLCQAIANACEGYHNELSTEAHAIAVRLQRLAEIEEFDLTKPF